MPGVKLNIPKGTKFGRLTIIKEETPYVLPSERKHRVFLCKCNCENKSKIKVLLKNLRSGNTTSCGCVSIERSTTHGLKNTHYTIFGVK
jgi:hypothetical protein